MTDYLKLNYMETMHELFLSTFSCVWFNVKGKRALLFFSDHDRVISCTCDLQQHKCSQCTSCDVTIKFLQK